MWDELKMSTLRKKKIECLLLILCRMHMHKRCEPIEIGELAFNEIV